MTTTGRPVRSRTLWLVVLVLMAQTAAGASQVVRSAEGFSFRFRVNTCTLDSTAGVLRHETEPRISTGLMLTHDQMTRIRDVANDIAFFDYPSAFIGVPLGLTAYSIDAAANSYRLELQIAGRAHAVTWMDSTRPTTEAADKLRRLLDTIVGFITDRGGYEALRSRGVDCK